MVSPELCWELGMVSPELCVPGTLSPELTELRQLATTAGPRRRAPVPATGSGEPLGTDAEPGPSLSDGVRGPSHPPGGCSVTRPPSCCVTRPRAWSRTPILNRFASLLAGGERRTT